MTAGSFAPRICASGSSARSKRADYICEYKSRVDEVYSYERTLWNIINSPGSGSRTQVEAVLALLKCTDALISLYDALPIINVIRDYGCGYDHDNKKDVLQLQQQDYHNHPVVRDDSDIDSRLA